MFSSKLMSRMQKLADVELDPYEKLTLRLIAFVEESLCNPDWHQQTGPMKEALDSLALDSLALAGVRYLQRALKPYDGGDQPAKPTDWHS